MFNITPTTESKALEELKPIDHIFTSALYQLKDAVKRTYDIIWHGEVSPIIKAQLLGEDAGEIFKALKDTQVFIKSLDPEWKTLKTPADYTLTSNLDGTVTIIDNE